MTKKNGTNGGETNRENLKGPGKGPAHGQQRKSREREQTKEGS